MRIEPEDLQGGNSTAVQRIGDTVRRTAGPWTPAVHRLLRILRERGVSEVPEPFGRDAEGREVLSYIPGTVANYPLPDWIWSDEIVEQASTLLRRMHDATAGVVLDGAAWQIASHHPFEVICHNDFAPYNMVFERERLVGVIDFDTASPGPRIWDFAYLAYRLVPFSEYPGAPAQGLRMSRLDAAIQAYGMPLDPDEVLLVMADRLDDLALYTDGRAKSSGSTDFSEHAATYRRDAQTIRTGRQ